MDHFNKIHNKVLFTFIPCLTENEKDRDYYNVLNHSILWNGQG